MEGRLQSAATIIANKRIYLNVNGFDYLRLTRLNEDQTAFDLVSKERTLRLAPLSDPLRDGQAVEDAHYVPAGALGGLSGHQLGEEDLAELFLDDDDD